RKALELHCFRCGRMRPSPKSKEDWPATDGRGLWDKRHPSCAAGSGCGIKSFTHRIGRPCDIRPKTRLSCSGFKTKWHGRAELCDVLALRTGSAHLSSSGIKQRGRDPPILVTTLASWRGFVFNDGSFLCASVISSPEL